MEGLKLIDLGNEVGYIDVDTSKVPYTFSVKLGDRTFAFSIRYNEVGGFFTVDLSIASTGEVLVYGDIVRYGRPLFNSVEDERFPVPVIMPLCLSETCETFPVKIAPMSPSYPALRIIGIPFLMLLRVAGDRL